MNLLNPHGRMFLSYFSIAVIKHHDKRNLEKGSSFGLMTTGRLSWLGSIAAGRHGGWQEQEAEGSHLKPET